MQDQKYFFCYNPDLSRYLKANGQQYITRAKHYATNKEFTLYLQTKEAIQLIQEWKTKQVN